MTKKTRRAAERLYQSLETIASSPEAGTLTHSLSQGERVASVPYPEPDGDEDTGSLEVVQGQAVGLYADSSRLPRLKRFRFQLLHQWLVHHFEPCRAADIGGGKGLLSYLLIQSGWQATVIDPAPQPLPDKYKDILSGSRVKIDLAARVPNIACKFDPPLAEGFDLLIGLHAHGCNVKIIDAAARFGCGFVLFPCCIIDEPFVPPPGVHWLESLAQYAVHQGHTVMPFRLNFKGQNIGLYALPPQG
jgi:hypothetical protein